MKNGMELLAPAGDLKIFKNAIDAGADAIYFGGDLFGARASAKNFTLDEAKEALSYAHNRNKKAYLTVNTLLKNTEIEQHLYDYILGYYENGLDGVIIQDFGVFQFIKSYFPDIELHASTQMNLSSVYGARFLKENGAQRIVTARELSLNEIKQIHDEVGIEIEAFVHGALCVCYSGNCLMSSFIGGRSGNRGRCAQPCRLPYSLYDRDKKSIDQGDKFYLSPKDLWGIHDLNRLYDAGVYSLKIEGRLKNAAYVTNVVSVYRKYVDRLLEFGSENYSVDKNDIKRLLDAGNRGGFTNTYFDYHNSKNMMDYDNSSFVQKNKTPFVGNADIKKTELWGELKAHKGNPISLNVWDETGRVVELSAGMVEESKSKPTTATDIEKKLISAGDSSYQLKHISFDIDDNVFVPLKFIKQLRRDALDYFSASNRKNALPYETLGEFSDKRDKTDFVIGITSPEQFRGLKDFDYEYSLVLKEDIWLKERFEPDSMGGKHQDIYVSLPVVIRQSTASLIKRKISLLDHSIKGYYVSSYDGLELLNESGISRERIFFDQRLYTFSNRSIKAFYDLGYKNFYAPLELNEKELMHRWNHTSELFVYGYVPLMYMANCVFSSTYPCKSAPESILYLKDRKNAFFPVKNQCFLCTNIIYNSVPVCLFDMDGIEHLHMNRLRLDFTIESQEETKAILDLFQSVYINKEKTEITIDYTRGHFKRGVL